MDKNEKNRRFMDNRGGPARVSNATRVREMNEVKNYNRQQQGRVFDMEKRQVQSESESIKPIDSKDAGAAFKLQTYISKLQQILGQKADLFSQLTASPFTDLNQLKGTTKQAGLLTMIVSKAEFVQSFNEMVAYVALFFKDIQSDNRVRDRMYAAYFTPLIDQMRQLSQNYPALFAGLPNPERGGRDQPATRAGGVYDLVRKETRDMYSLLNVAADNIQDGIFRPIGAKDVAEYSRDNNVNMTFAKNPAPPGPVIPSMAVQQGQQQIAIADANQRAGQVKADEIAMSDPYNPAGDTSLPPRTAQLYAAIQQQVRSAGGNPAAQIPTLSFREIEARNRRGTLSNELAQQIIQSQFAVFQLANPQYTRQKVANMEDENFVPLLQTILPTITLYNDWVTSRGIIAPPPREEAPPPVDPQLPPAPGPQQPALPLASDADLDQVVQRWVADNNYPADKKLPIQDSGKGEFGGERWRPIVGMEAILTQGGMRASAVARIKEAITRYNAAIPKQKPGKKPKSPAQPQPGQAGPAPQAQPNYDSFNIAQANSPENRGIVAAILRAEEQKGGLLDSQSQADADRVLTILEQDNRGIFDDVMARENNDRGQARMDTILPLMAAVNSSKRAASRADNRPEGDYVGLGMSGCGFADNLNQYLQQQGIIPPKKKHTLESLAGDAMGALGNSLISGVGDFFSGKGRRQYAPEELDFIPGQMTQFNSAMPVKSQGYGAIHRPRFAQEEEMLRAGSQYIRQDRVAYNKMGGLGMVNPDSEIGVYQVLHMAGEGMSGGVYLPQEYINQPAGEKEFFGYGVDGDNDVFGMSGGVGSLKRRLGMTNPFAVSRDYHYLPKDQSGYDDRMDFAYGNHEEPVEATQQAHEEEEEKPVDLDENPNPFRVRNENYKVNTGKMKKVSYKMPNM